MAIIQPSASLTFSQFRIGRRRYDYDEVSEETGSVATRPRGNARWALSIASPSRMNEAQADLWVPLAMKMRGRVNHLEAWDFFRPAPKGTMRGTLTLLNAVAIGDTTAVVTGGVGQAGTTLKARDWLQFGVGLGTSQLVMVTDNATANGSGQITITFVNEARIAFSAGTAVAWDKPKGYFKMVTDEPGWEYEAGMVEAVSGVAMDFLEQWQ